MREKEMCPTCKAVHEKQMHTWHFLYVSMDNLSAIVEWKGDRPKEELLLPIFFDGKEVGKRAYRLKLTGVGTLLNPRAMYARYEEYPIEVSKPAK